jgi:Carboxypeptidase regulatory-like domain/TonB-dependent Receptor Plug Domain
MNSMIKIAAFSVLAAVGLTLAPLAAAQTAGTGSMMGTVKDPKGLLVAGARVIVRNLDTGAARALVTNGAGLYAAPYLAPGRYELRASKPGLAEVLRPNVLLEVGQALKIDIELPLATARESITVTAEAPLVNVGQTGVSQEIAAFQVENLPLNGRRWDNLALLTPATSEDGGSGLISFRGISGLYNNNLVDGADNNQAFFAEARGRNRVPYGYSLDAIQEFQVLTANYSAEYGRAAGGIVNAITRSGTNQLHGDAFYFIRDDLWLARDPVANASGQPKPAERRQQFGGSLGGPIRPEKLFFFLNYDEQKHNFPIIVSPTSPATFAQQIATCESDAALAGDCRTVAAALAPLVNATLPRTGDNYLGLGKVDYQINPANRLSAVVNILRWDSPNGILASPVLHSSVLADGSDQVHNQFVNANLNSVLRPTLVNEARFQFGEDFEFESPNHSGPNFNFGSSSGVAAADLGMPTFLPRGKFPDETRYEWVDNLSWTRGRHLIKTGFDVNHVHDSLQNLFQGGGAYSYSGPTALANFTSDLFLGTRSYSSFTQNIDPITGSGRGDFSTNEYNAYFQDTFHWRANVTVYAGLRYEVQVMPGAARPNPLIPESRRLNTDWNNFGPRLGFAWDIGGNGRRVIRAGYGIYFGRTENSTIFTALFQDGAFQQSFSVKPSLGTACAPAVPDTLFPQPSTAPAFGPIFGTSGPVPQAMYSNLEALLAACPAASGSSVASALDPGFVNPLVHEYDAAYEQELPGKLVLTASYLGSRAIHLPVFYDANLPPPDSTRSYLAFGVPGGSSQPIEFTVPFFSAAASRPRPGVGVLVMGRSIVNAWYNALVIRLRRRAAHGFSFDANFTLSKAMDDGQVPGPSGTFFGTDNPLNPYDIKAEYGLSDLDVRRRFVMNFYWAAPFEHWTRSRGGRAFLGGWKVSGILRAQDTPPVTALVSLPSTFFTSGGGGCLTGDGGLTCGTIAGTGARTGGRVPFLQRNAQFNIPGGLVAADLRITREFALNEHSSFEVIAEGFNLFNRTNTFSVNTTAYSWEPPNAGSCQLPGATNFNGCLVPNAQFLAPTSTGNTLYTARQWQFGARFRF